MTSKILRNSTLKLSLTLGALLLAGAAGNAQTGAPGCTLAKGAYTCNGGLFRTTLNAAKTASIDVSPRDRMAQSQLKDLILHLGKSVEPANAPADLVFVVVPTDNDGVQNAGDADLGSLLIYAGGTDGSRGGLLWGDTYRGQIDMPWPAVIHALIVKFQSQFTGH
jgi:hypothetical protein